MNIRNQVGGRTHRGGFTLVELLVVVIIIGILGAVAFPTFELLTNSARVTNPANEVLATLQQARMESIRRGERAVVCGSANANSAAPSCDAAGGGWTGWISFIDANRNSNFDAGEVVLKVGVIEAPATLTASPAVSATNRIVFRPDGLARTATGALLAAQVSVCVPTTRPADNVRDVQITSGSRMAVARRNGAGACAAPANS